MNVNIFWVYVWSRTYQAYNAHAPYCRLWPVQYSSHIISQTALFLRKSHWTQNVCFDFLYNFCVKHFSLYEELSEILSEMHRDLRVKYPLFMSYFNETWIFSTYFRKTPKYKISRKSVQCEPSCSMRTDRQTDMRNFFFNICGSEHHAL